MCPTDSYTVFHPILLATLQEFNILILQMETCGPGRILNLPGVTEMNSTPHRSDSKLKSFLGSALQWPFLLKAIPLYLFIMWFTRQGYITQHIYLHGNLVKQGTGYLLYVSDEKWYSERQEWFCHRLADRAANLDLFCCTSTLVIKKHLPQNIARVKLVITCDWCMCCAWQKLAVVGATTETRQEGSQLESFIPTDQLWVLAKGCINTSIWAQGILIMKLLFHAVANPNLSCPLWLKNIRLLDSHGMSLNLTRT